MEREFGDKADKLVMQSRSRNASRDVKLRTLRAHVARTSLDERGVMLLRFTAAMELETRFAAIWLQHRQGGVRHIGEVSLDGGLHGGPTISFVGRKVIRTSLRTQHKAAGYLDRQVLFVAEILHDLG